MKLNSKRIGRKLKNVNIYSYNSVDSTNIVAKKLASNGCDEGAVVCALSQTAGKGRLGRTFLSQRGGVYFSVVLRPKNDSCDTIFITVAAAVAAARAIESVSGKKCDIKWVNDVYISNKKVCGILTEGSINDGGALEYAILGVGINLFKPKNGFPAELPLAGCVFDKNRRFLFKNQLKERTIVEFCKEFFAFYDELSNKNFIAEYQQRSFLTGKEITYIKDETKYSATVQTIDDDAHLVVLCDGEKQVLSCGEIQIVGMEQLTV